MATNSLINTRLTQHATIHIFPSIRWKQTTQESKTTSMTDNERADSCIYSADPNKTRENVAKIKT